MAFTQETIIPSLLQLPLYDVLKACQTNRLFATTCRESEILWYNLVLRDYHSSLPSKPSSMTWRDFYISIWQSQLKYIPVYFQGNRIAFVPFDSRNLRFTLQALQQYLTGPINIFFLTQLAMPVDVIRYPTENYFRERPFTPFIPQPNPTSYQGLERTTLIPNTIMNTGRGRNPSRKTMTIIPERRSLEDQIAFIRQANNLDWSNVNKILLTQRDQLLELEDELTSGNPPIYGTIRIDGRFIIYNRPPNTDTDLRTKARFRFCHTIQKRELIEMLRILQNPQNLPELSDDAYEYWRVNTDGYPANDAQISFFYLIDPSYSRDAICDLLKKELDKIGHYFPM